MDKEFLATVSGIVIVSCTLIGGVAFTSSQRSKAMVEMVSKGANPMAVSCALEGINTSNQIACNALAMQLVTIK